MAATIVIVDYDRRWPELFEVERRRLRELGDPVVDVQHVGSTAVPGLAAKPIIDILVGVTTLEAADATCVSRVVELGYEHVPALESALPHRRYFRRSSPEGVRTHHVHLVEVDGLAWRDHVLFRDYLRSHAETRTAYERLKRELARRDWQSGLDYAAAKTEFVEAVLAKALAGP